MLQLGPKSRPLCWLPQAALEAFRTEDMGGRVFAASAGSAPTVNWLLSCIIRNMDVHLALPPMG